MDRIINFPEINWEKLKEGAISKEMVWEKLQEGIKFLLNVGMLKKTNLLAPETLQKAKEVLRGMEELNKKFPQVLGMIQNIFGRQAKEMAATEGDSRALFSRLEFLVQEAMFYRVLAEWKEEELVKVPYGLKKDFEIRLYDPRSKQARHFLPASWRNDTHKRTALVLHDLSFKARETYKTEKGITKTEPIKTESEIKTESKPQTRKPRTKKTKPEQAPEDKAGKQVKASKAKAREKEDENEIKKVKSLSDLDFLKK
jgi:hypothetical protein